MDSLFDKDRPSIDARFREFDRGHPEVFREFAALASSLLARGFTHYSADAILHVVRFHRAVNPERDGGFTINNDFSSRYARLLATTDPRFSSFFEFRELREGAA